VVYPPRPFRIPLVFVVFIRFPQLHKYPLSASLLIPSSAYLRLSNSPSILPLIPKTLLGTKHVHFCTQYLYSQPSGAHPREFFPNQCSEPSSHHPPDHVCNSKPKIISGSSNRRGFPRDAEMVCPNTILRRFAALMQNVTSRERDSISKNKESRVASVKKGIELPGRNKLPKADAADVLIR